MIGILFVEIKTHGVLPYSVECADDETFIEKLRENDLSTSQESCIDDSSNALIRKCTQKNPDERASLAEIISEHSRILLEGENNATARVSFPDLNDEKYMPSLGYKKGTLQLKNYVKPFQIELLKEMSNNMWLFTMNKNVFVRQKMNHRISSCTLKTIKSDSMRKILPQVYVFVITDGKDEFIDIHLPSSCKHSLDDLLEKKDIDGSISAYVEIVKEVANMLKTIHDNACVIGVLEVSNIFISQSRDGIMVHPVSLAYFSAIPNGGVASTMFDVLYDDSNSSERYAPEVTESKRFTKESDIYSLGQFCFQLYHRCTEIAKKEQTQNWIDNTNVTRSVSSLIDLPKILVDLFQNCILCDPTKRPKINYFIGCLKLLKQQMSDLQHKSNCVLHESILNASEPSTSAIYSETSVYVKENFIDPTILNPSEIDFSNHDYESTAHNETRHSIIFANETFLADSVLNPFEYEKVMQASLERVNPYNLLFEQSNGNTSLIEQVYDGINYVEPYGSVSNIYEVPILKKSFSGVLKNIKKAAQSFVKKKLKKNSKVNGRSNLYANVEDNYDVPQNARRSLPPPPIESDSENYIEIPSNTSITEDYPVLNDYLFQTYFSSSDKQDSFSQDDSLSQV
ncbi:uncharacterized protein LOC131950308 [Physella acuta]|uniref:uncharacterized protein LOC131950308 n=1 Tax=Physella acuta TaxID=109671 RepID=UPI0027DC5D9A|nr:uncharacterized protein LOC131950308 [Physella acuta]